MKYIQNGTFREEGNQLFGNLGFIKLNQLKEKDLLIILKSYERIFNVIENYGFHNTGLYSNNDELVLFYDYEKPESIKDIFNNKELFLNSKYNFWWSIDNDWMLIPNSKKNYFKQLLTMNISTGIKKRKNL